MLEDSILKSTKTMLGIAENYDVYDLEILTQINSVFTHLYQLGIGTAAPIVDDDALWSNLLLPPPQLNMVKTFVFLKVKMAFDPPSTSYLIEAAKAQIDEQEWRLRESAEIDFS